MRDPGAGVEDVAAGAGEGMGGAKGMEAGGKAMTGGAGIEGWGIGSCSATADAQGVCRRSSQP
jgi:hypothetical protein